MRVGEMVSGEWPHTLTLTGTSHKVHAAQPKNGMYTGWSNMVLNMHVCVACTIYRSYWPRWPSAWPATRTRTRPNRLLVSRLSLHRPPSSVLATQLTELKTILATNLAECDLTSLLFFWFCFSFSLFLELLALPQRIYLVQGMLPIATCRALVWYP